MGYSQGHMTFIMEAYLCDYDNQLEQQRDK